MKVSGMIQTEAIFETTQLKVITVKYILGQAKKKPTVVAYAAVGYCSEITSMVQEGHPNFTEAFTKRCIKM